MTLFLYILMEENWNMDILVTCMAHIKDLQRINTLYTNTAYKCTIKHKIERGRKIEKTKNKKRTETSNGRVEFRGKHNHSDSHILETLYMLLCSCGSVVEHCVSNAKGCGFNSQGTHILTKCIAWISYSL